MHFMKNKVNDWHTKIGSCGESDRSCKMSLNLLHGETNYMQKTNYFKTMTEKKNSNQHSAHN